MKNVNKIILFLFVLIVLATSLNASVNQVGTLVNFTNPNVSMVLPAVNDAPEAFFTSDLMTKVLVAPAGMMNELPKVNVVFGVVAMSAVAPTCVPSKYNFALFNPEVPVVVEVAESDETFTASPDALNVNRANSWLV